MKKITMFFAAMLFALVAFAQDTETTVPEVTTMEELKQHAGERVLYKGLEPKKVKVVAESDPSFSYEELRMPDGETALAFPGQYFVKPAKMDVYGTYNAEYAEYPGMDPVPTFVVENNEDVVAVYAFNSVGDLVDFVNEIATPEQKNVAYDIVEPVVVSLTLPRNSSSYYIQYEVSSEYSREYFGVMAVAGGKGRIAPLSTEEGVMPYMPTIGDMIKVKGAYVPMSSEYDENSKRIVTKTATFMVESATLVEANQEINIAKIESGEALGVERATLSGSYVALLGGKVVERDGLYYYERMNMDMETYEQVVDSILLERSGDINLSEASDLALCGILVFDIAIQDFILYAVEFRDLTLYAENLAEMFEFGKTNEMQEQYVLKNPVLVTYVDVNGNLVVEDETATAYVQLAVELDEDWNVSVPGLENLQVGYYITKFVGVPSSSNGYLKFADVNATNLVKGEEGTITPIEVALKDLIADREAETSQYAFKVVSVKDITFELWSEEDGEVTDAYLVQNNGETLDSVVTNVKIWRKLGVAVPEIGAKIETLVGIADIYSAITGAMGYVSIQPLNAASVVVPGAGDQTNVENVEVANVYSENGLIVAEGEFQIFTITGQNVTDMNGKLQGGVYVVRTANATAKVVVK